tara:strand:+ start:343 stop:1041 length:699 start_codon:yes stop_codon:yes gene_type:complete
MKISIHQPNFFPWLGYFEKINKSDIFLFLDDTFVTNNLDFLNRSYFINNGNKKFFSVSIKRNFSIKKISELELDNNYPWKMKFLNYLNENYKKKIFFDDVMYIINEILSFETKFITEFNVYAIKKLIKILDIKTKINYSSNFNLDTNSSQKILDLVKLNNCKKYISGAGGKNYLNQKEFSKEKIEIIFVKSEVTNYNQGNSNFIPGLSILDQLFNCGIEQTIETLNEKKIKI